MGSWTGGQRGGRRAAHGLSALAAVLLLLPGLLAFSTSEARAGLSPAKRLAGTNVIRGTTTKGMNVTLPRAVFLDLDRLARQTSVSGAGRAVGMILTGSDLADPERPFLAALRAGFCGSRGCAPTRAQREGFSFWGGDWDQETGVLRLPAGEYQLYVVADGGPVKVVLRLPGLRGRARFRPGASATSSIGEPQVGMGAGPGGMVYSAGDVHDVTGQEAFSFQALRIRAEAWGAGEVGYCIYGEDPPPEPAAFAPGCPAGTNVPITDAVVTPAPLTRIYGNGAARYGAGTFGHGVWYSAAAAVTEASSVSFFIDFQPLS